MLTYESVVTLLLSGAERSGLNVQFSHEQLDPHTMSRTFNLICLPSGITEPRGDLPFATLSFMWDASFTALSVMGSDGLCDLYHAPDEPCPHQELGCAYDAMLDIDVQYDLPLSEKQRFDVANVPMQARAIQELSAATSSLHIPLDVEVQMQFTSGFQAFVGRIFARQQWMLDEQLHEERDLKRMFRDICRDITALLNAFAGLEIPASVADDEADEESETPQINLGHYLRPPTA